jgi:hypothetical protein
MRFANVCDQMFALMRKENTRRSRRFRLRSRSPLSHGLTRSYAVPEVLVLYLKRP